MAKGSVRKKGKKWYYRFYIEDESGKQVQREFAGTESKSETEALLRKAMEDYEEKKFVAKSENATVGMLLDMWVEEELKPSNLSNGTVMAYQGTVNRIKQYPIGNRKLKSVTADHLQAFMDFLSFGGTNPDGTTAKALSKGYLRLFSAVLQGAFRFAVFPKRLISFNPMQYVVWRGKKEKYELFSDEDGETTSTPTLTHEQYLRLEDFLKAKDTGITKAGNSHLRKLLVETAQVFGRSATKSGKSVALKERQAKCDSLTVAYADKANARLKKKYFKIAMRSRQISRRLLWQEKWLVLSGV